MRKPQFKFLIRGGHALFYIFHFLVPNGRYPFLYTPFIEHDSTTSMWLNVLADITSTKHVAELLKTQNVCKHDEPK